jgi:hypothetical protein
MVVELETDTEASPLRAGNFDSLSGRWRESARRFQRKRLKKKSDIP